MEVKVEIYKNRIVVSSSGQSKTVLPREPFTSARLIVGHFKPAADCLKSALKEIEAVGIFKSKPKLSIFAMEMNEGGLSEVEERCLLELGYHCGAKM